MNNTWRNNFFFQRIVTYSPNQESLPNLISLCLLSILQTVLLKQLIPGFYINEERRKEVLKHFIASSTAS